MASYWGEIQRGCPQCGGTLDYFYFGADCRGNPVSRGVNCKQCKYKKDHFPDFVLEHLGKKGIL